MKNLLVIGGSGFLGSAVVRELARRPASADFCYTLPTRREAGAKHLSVLPTARVVEADVHDPATLARLKAILRRRWFGLLAPKPSCRF